MKNAQDRKLVYCADVELNLAELSAVEAWQRAHCISSQSQALRELVRLGLLAEIRKVYEISVKSREQASDKVDCAETL